MTAKETTYKGKTIVSVMLMLFALLWLTVSTPFVYACQQQLETSKETGKAAKTEKNTNPFSSTTEEKSESGVNAISEYLHETSLPGHPVQPLVKHQKCHPSNLYLAFHPELLCPPPNLQS